MSNFRCVLMMHLLLAFTVWIAISSVSCLAAAAGHQVKAKDNEVALNEVIDSSDLERTWPSQVTSLGNGNIKIFSKTFTPPQKYRFKQFEGISPITRRPTHVDVWDNPEGMDYDILRDTQSAIEVVGAFAQPTNAGQFPLKAEGNLKRRVLSGDGDGGQGVASGGEPTKYHWSAMVREEEGFFVYLTFDDGPLGGTDDSITVLNRHDIPGTFLWSAYT